MNDRESEMEPLISVVIPVYNVESYLADCIDSVTSQTYRALEIVLVDDGSTDGSGKMCDEYALRDDRIRVIHSENHGLGAARNIGIGNAGGEYITFLDSDDWVEPDTIEALITTALLHGADVTAAGMTAEYKGTRAKVVRSDAGAKVFRGGEILPAFAKAEIGNVATNKLYRIGCFDSLRFPEGRVYEDVPVAWRMMTCLAKNGGTVAILPDRLYHIRMRKGSLSHVRSYKNVSDCWESYHEKYLNMPDFRDECLPHCFMAIGRMWGSFSSFSKEEKKQAENLVEEMNSFSKEKRRHVMKGDFSRITKLICLYSQRKGAFVMRLCNLGVKLRAAFGKSEKKMYD